MTDVCTAPFDEEETLLDPADGPGAGEDEEATATSPPLPVASELFWLFMYFLFKAIIHVLSKSGSYIPGLPTLLPVMPILELPPFTVSSSSGDKKNERAGMIIARPS